MPQVNKPIEEDQDEGAPEWMVTFSDCMTLLLTFFVLLLSFSSFDAGALGQLQESMGKGMPFITSNQEDTLESISKRDDQVQPIEKIPEGSRTPTLNDEALGNLAKKRRLTDFRQQKVFAIASDQIFIGEGSAIFPRGRQILDKMAVLLKVMPSRVVICEFDPAAKVGGDNKGVGRAWSVMDYLIRQDIDSQRFSITGSTMLNSNNKINKRQLVITLLERGVYE